jgi:TonB-dependent receptor
MDHLEKNEAHEWAERLDFDLAFDDSPWLKSLRFGVRATDKEAITRETGWNWSLLSNQFWGNGGGAAVYLNQTPASAADHYQYSNFMRGKMLEPTATWFPSDSLVSNGTAHAYSILQATETSGWGWTPLTNDFTKANPGGDNVNGGINTQSEKTFAGYGMIRFEHGTPIGKLDGNFGVRYVSTRISARSNTSLQINPLSSGTPAACSALGTVDCTKFNAAYAFTQGANQSGTSVTNNYNDVLPTLNLRLHITDTLQWRLAFGKAMTRPSFSQMQAFTSVSFGFDSNFQYTTGPTGTGGNPKLKPIRSDQADTSLEWYFAPTGSLTFAAFYKDISNYIFQGDLMEGYTSNGQTISFDVTRNINGSHGTVKGFELAYQQFFDMLPGALSGLGVQANYTLVDSSGGRNTAINLLESAQQAGASDQTLPLEGLSKHSYNFALMYEKYGVSARLAYNWRDRYLLTTSAANIQRPVWSESYGQLDGSVFYSITDNIKIGLQGTNLLNTRTFLDVGGATLAPRYSWTDTDRRVAAALRVSF